MVELLTKNAISCEVARSKLHDCMSVKFDISIPELSRVIAWNGYYSYKTFCAPFSSEGNEGIRERKKESHDDVLETLTPAEITKSLASGSLTLGLWSCTVDFFPSICFIPKHLELNA